MFKKFILICLNFLLIITCFACNNQPETAINSKINPPQTGWKILEGEKIVIALPEKFEGGNPARKLTELTEKLKTLDCVKEKTTEKLEQNAKALSLIAFLPQCEADHLVTGINIISQKIKAETTLDQYLENEINKLQNKANLIEQEIINQNQLSIGKIITEIKLDQITLKQLFYIVPNDQTYWIITYSSTAEQFEKNLPIFEDSFKTFQILS